MPKDEFHILNNIRRYVDLDEEEIKAFESIIEEREIPRKSFIVKPGQVCRYQSYVVQGSFRNYLIDQEGQEHTLQFALEDWFISDFSSYLNQAPASLFVEAMEHSKVQQIEFHKVEAICDRFPKFDRFFRLVAQRSFAFAQKRLLSNLGESAEERYQTFYKMYPQIVHRVPQYALASYLGMSAEFLSKIRRRIAKN